MTRKKQKIGPLPYADVNAFVFLDVKTMQPLKIQPHHPKPAQGPSLAELLAAEEAEDRKARRERLEQALADRGNAKWNNRKTSMIASSSSFNFEADERLARSEKRVEALERREWRAGAEAIQKAGRERREREAEKQRLKFREKVETARRQSAVDKEMAEIKAQELEYLRREHLETSAERIRKREEQELEAMRERLRAHHASYLARNLVNTRLASYRVKSRST